MSEREGLYCEKHAVWCPGGVCDYCEPDEQCVPPPPGGWASIATLTPAMEAIVERPCNHAAGYCKDTAHKYELPVE